MRQPTCQDDLACAEDVGMHYGYSKGDVDVCLEPLILDADEVCWADLNVSARCETS